jgi:hypothetical protein
MAVINFLRLKAIFIMALILLSCNSKNSNNKKESKINMEYQNKLNACKSTYPFKRWRDAFKNGLEQYTETNCNKIESVFDNLITALVTAGENAAEKDKVALFKTAILETNTLNDEIEGLIETGEREDLCELTDIITRACGLDPEKYGAGEGLASEWRDW